MDTELNRAQVCRQSKALLIAILLHCLVACSPFQSEPTPGPDKQGSGLLSGAALGAGSGAITGAQLGSAAGPAAFVGMGIGAIFGSMSGLGTDLLEEDVLRREEQAKRMREVSWVQETLSEHYARRLELHPNREIFPADIFFVGDSVTLSNESTLLARELARMLKNNSAWSRLVIASYTTAKDKESDYAAHVTKRRAEEIAAVFVSTGIDPRRLSIRQFTLKTPILIDPDDSPDRYRQALEFVALDK